MSTYRRNYVRGGTYFFTLVTHDRAPFLTTDLGREFLRDAIETVQAKSPFTLFATVLLPEHLHAIWILPPGDCDYSTRWRQIKEQFTRKFLKAGGSERPQSASRIEHGQRGIWQKRYWEHTVRDEKDLKRCVDYIHWNPKKHGHVKMVRDWPWSSFHRFVRLGEYECDWGGTDPCPNYDTPEWGQM